jgi:hypothetical protein
MDPARAKRRQLDAVADQINERFGQRAIRRGGALRQPGDG